MATITTATNLNEASQLFIPDANKIHQILNGDADTTVSVENGYIPTIRKVYADNLYFYNEVLAWTEGNNAISSQQLYNFGGLLYWAPSATSSDVVPLGTTPVGDDSWQVAPTRWNYLQAVAIVYNTTVDNVALLQTGDIDTTSGVNYFYDADNEVVYRYVGDAITGTISIVGDATNGVVIITMSDDTTYNIRDDANVTELKAVAITNNTTLDNVGFLYDGAVLTGQKYLRVVSEENTYFVAGGVTGNVSNSGTDVNGVRTISTVSDGDFTAVDREKLLSTGYAVMPPSGSDDSEAIQSYLDIGIPVYLLPSVDYKITSITIPVGGVLRGFGRKYTRITVLDGGAGIVTYNSGSISQTQVRISGFQILGENKSTSNGLNLQNCAHSIFDDIWIRNCNIAMYLMDALLNTFKDFYLQDNNIDMWLDPDEGTNLNTFYNFKLNSSDRGILVGKDDDTQTSTQCYGNEFIDVDIEKERLALDVRTGSTASPALIFSGGVFEAQSDTESYATQCEITGNGWVKFDHISLGDVSRDSQYSFITSESDGKWDYLNDCTVTTSATSFTPCDDGKYEVDTFVSAITDSIQSHGAEFLKSPVIEALSVVNASQINSYVFGTVSADEGFEILNLINNDTGGSGESDPIGGTAAYNRTTTLTKSGTSSTGTAGQPVTLQVFVKVVGSTRNTFTINYNNDGTTVASKTYTYNGNTGWAIAYLSVPASLVTTDVHQFQLFGIADLHIWHPQMCVGTSKITPPMGLGEVINQPEIFNGYMQKQAIRRGGNALASGEYIDFDDLCDNDTPNPTFLIRVHENISSSSKVTSVYYATLVYTRTNDTNGISLVSTMTTGTVVASRVSVSITPLTSGAAKGLRFTATDTVNDVDITLTRID